jgi:DNA-3-methyladenine glycosylase
MPICEPLDNAGGQPLPHDFFRAGADHVAKKLIGTTVLLNGIGGMIVETEAYDMTDPAAHCYGGPTAINESMFLDGGHVYVCPGRFMLHLNFVCGEANCGSAVLIRALHPFRTSIETMRRRRGPTRSVKELCSGPGKLGEALHIACKHDGAFLYDHPFVLRDRDCPVSISKGPRINTPRACDRMRRFGLKDSPFLSKPFDERSFDEEPSLDFRC